MPVFHTGAVYDVIHERFSTKRVYKDDFVSFSSGASPPLTDCDRVSGEQANLLDGLDMDTMW